MRALALDVSYRSTGWAYMDGEPGCAVPELLGSGAVESPDELLGYGGLEYPFSHLAAAEAAALRIVDRVNEAARNRGAGDDAFLLDNLVIEETNPGGSGHGNRYTNKILEWVHMALLRHARAFQQRGRWPVPTYLSNNVWRSVLGLKMADGDKRNNKLIRKARARQKASGGKFADICRELGATETVLVDRKMLSVRHANRTFGLDFKKSDNDRAEAICICHAFFRGAGARLCTGV